MSVTGKVIKEHKRTGASCSYEGLAPEYYKPKHITSRNFDEAIHAWFAESSLQLPDVGYVLDLGAGQGKALTYCKFRTSRVIQADLSLSMLTLTPREPSCARVNCDALAMPFKAASFAVITAFLFDPFNKPPLEFETFRVLKSGGVFVGTLPHALWGKTLRSLRGLDVNKARFLLDSGSHVERDSYLGDEADLRARFVRAGYHNIKTASLVLPRHVLTVSPDVEDVAQRLGIDAYDLTLVLLLIATKP